MNTVKKFFKKYLLSTFSILFLFIFINITLLLAVMLFAWKSQTSPLISSKYISENIIIDANGDISTNKSITEELINNNAWAMLLDESGQIIWENRMPTDLPREYSIVDVAKFSKSYLDEYPIFTEDNPLGLLVIGYEPNRIAQYNFSIEPDYIITLIRGFSIMILINLLLIIVLFWKNTRKVENSITPILEGIETLSTGQNISLPISGELSEINEKLNHTGDLLVKKEQTRLDWINGISHDIRTPLSLIVGYANEIENDPNNLENTRLYGNIILTQSKKISSLVSGLNLISKLEYSIKPLKIEIVYPIEMIRQIVSEFINSGLSKKFTFDLNYENMASDIKINGDITLLSRALNNLVQNSINHNPNGCSISINIVRENDKCLISISDDGVGISEEQIKQFNSGNFKRADYKTKNEISNGFGLNLVSQIIKSHKGTLLFENNNSSGLKVIISLPI